MRDRLANLIVQEIFNGVTADEIIEVEYRLIPGTNNQVPSGLKIGGKLLDVGEIIKLKHEAEIITETELWGLVTKRVQYIAQVHACEKSESLEDTTWPKAIIYSLQEIQKVFNIIKSFETIEKKEKK